MNPALAGLTVVVLRPSRQAGRLLELVAAAGARALSFPTLVIEPLPVERATADLALARTWDWALYTSANAVRAALDTLQRLPGAARHAAIGRATARALEQHGIAVDACPVEASSEGLLALPEFADPAGQALLLVKGAGGRELVRETLLSRHAELQVLEIYRRAPASPTDAALEALREVLSGVSTRRVLVATSVEILEALFTITPLDLHEALRDSALVVPGTRVATAANGLGWRAAIVHAATAEDESVLEVLLARSAGSVIGA